MKTLYFLALIAFVLAVGSAIPLSEEKAKALDNALYAELKKVASDLPREDAASDVVDEEVKEDEESEEDEEDENNDDDELNEDEDENTDEEDEEDEDSDDEDEADENGISLPSSSLQKSSDPFIGLVVKGAKVAGHVVRGVRHAINHFRRRRRGRRGRGHRRRRGGRTRRGRRRRRGGRRRRRRFGRG